LDVDTDTLVVNAVGYEGRVGIGTATPTEDLEISRATGTATITPVGIRLSSTSTGSDWNITESWGNLDFYSADTSGGGAGVKARIGVITETTSGNVVGLNFQTSGSTGLLDKTMILSSDGSLEIDGTLAVKGDFLRFSEYRGFVYDPATNHFGFSLDGAADIDTSVMLWDDSGNVGIGTTTPSEKLEVNGNILQLDNDKHLFGTTNTDLQISSDGTNPVYNSTGVHTFYNSTGLGTIRYGSALTSTTVDNTTTALEEFNLGNDLYNEDGSINHIAFGDCYRQINDTDFSRPEIEYYNKSYLDEDGIEQYSFLNRTIYPHTKLTDVVDLTCEQAQQRQALALINQGWDLSENLSKSNKPILSTAYITNTTKDPATLTKVENFYNTLNSKTYQQMKDLVLTDEGKLSNNVLFDYELSPFGSYELGAIGHTNRAMNVLMMWKIANIEDKQNQQLDCWDLTTQAEIVTCMREI